MTNVVNKTNKKVNNKKLKAYVYPNVLSNKTEVIQSNLAWQCDNTHINTELQGHPGSSHTLYLIVDVATNHIVAGKVFFKQTNRGSITSNKILKVLKNSIEQNNITDSLLIHTDRGPEFTSKEYYEYIESHDKLIGSHTTGGSPNSNAVVERIIRTIKNQCLTVVGALPQSVKQTRDLQRVIHKKINYLNTQHLNKKK